MKERIEKIVIALFSLFGAFVVYALIHEYMPSWVYYSCIGIFIVWFLYDVSKPEKKKKHYWLYVIDYDQRIFKGVISTSEEAFSLPKKHVETLHDINNISVIEISKETFDLITSKQ